MQPLHIKTSEENRTVVEELTRKFFPQNGPRNVAARIALAYSLSRGHRLEPKYDLRDTKGQEYKEETLLSTAYRPYYVALLCQLYGLHKNDPHLGTYLKMHVDDGLTRLGQLFAQNPSLSGLDFLMQYIERGTDALTEVVPGMVKNSRQRVDKGHFSGPATLRFGQSLDGTPIDVILNDTTARNNANLAVVGSPGTGKTQFALDLLRQFTKLSPDINFLYLDFKGLKQDDVKKLKPFFDQTRTVFVNAPHEPFPLNPLTFIDNVNEKNQLMGVSKFVDIITTYAPRMGPTQTQLLKDATREAFGRQKGGGHPTLRQVYECLRNLTDDKPDTLTEIMQNLGELEIFAEVAADPSADFIKRNYYFSLAGDLPRTVRFTSTFLTIYYLYNTFMNMPDAPVENDRQALRYVLLIDEAHVLFKERKTHDLLDRLMREIRSKGVVVILVSQGIEEFNQPTLDFASLCENAVLLNIKDKNMRHMTRFLGFSSERDATQLAESMGQIRKGQAVTNVPEFQRGELFEVNQAWRVIK